MGNDWSTLALTEFFTAISRPGDIPGAALMAVERAAEATDAEIGAVIFDGTVPASIGVGRQSPERIFAALSAADETLTIAGLGTFHSTAQTLGHGSEGFLILARLGDSFAPKERQMLQGMAKVLGLALRGLRTLDAERSLRRDREREAEERLMLVRALERREQLLATLLRIQRAVSQRAPLQVVLDAVTRGAADVLDGAHVALILRDDHDPDETMIASITQGHDADRHDPGIRATAVQAMLKDHPVETGALLAAPVHAGGDVAGSLVFARTGDTPQAEEHHNVLAAFAEQATLALTGARSLAAVREAYHDGLTGLPNRTLFLERLERAQEVANRTGVTIAVLFLDLDLFKQVNDSLGHAAGDELLRGVADRLRGCVRAGDMAARLGGDEFAILLEPVDGAGAAHEIAERVIAAIRQPFQIAGTEVLTRASVGIALGDRSCGPGSDLVQDADTAMYRAKKTRPGSVTMFEPAMRAELVRHVELVTDAERAFAAGEFRLVYQPIVTLPGAGLVGVEALLRWTHPRLGPISPATFIPLAEQSGLITELGRWVLRTSCRQLARWRAAGLPELTLNVNLSSRQLEDDRLSADVLDSLAGAGVPAAALTLEVTETALMRDPDQVLRRLQSLKTIGVRLALDDFGTGYSSLSHLSQFPIDQLKIDKSFIDGLAYGGRRSMIVRSVLELGARLQVQTVAEGVEDQAQLAALSALPCDLAQGYLFARPMAADELMAYAVGPGQHDDVLTRPGVAGVTV